MSTVLAILFSSALGRTLGASDFGLYFMLVSFSTFAYVVIDWGQQVYVTREAARQPERGSVLLGTVLVLRTAGAALVAVLSGLAVWALGYDAMTCWLTIAFIIVSLPFFLAQTYGTVFRARDRMGLDACVSVANKIALLLLALLALALHGGIPSVLAMQALAGVLALVFAARLYRRVTTSRLRYSSQIAAEVMVSGMALLTANVACNIQTYIDAVVLSKLAPADAVGWYGAAKSIMGTMIMPALILAAASFPALSRAAADKEAFKAAVRTALRPILWLGALAATGVYLFADDAIAIVYGQRHFAPSGIILKVYAPAFLLIFLNTLLLYALFALHKARAFAVVKFGSVAVSTALALALIPAFQQSAGNGGIGVVAAFVASEFVVAAGALYLMRQSLGLDMAVSMAQALGSAALTLLFFWGMPPLPFLTGVSVCVIVFSFCSVGLGLVRRSDLELFRALLRKSQPAPESSASSF